MKMTRAEKAGRALGRCIIEMCNLMYQKNTSGHFLKGLATILNDHCNQRFIKLRHS